MALFSRDDLDFLARPHIARCWFGEFDLPSGRAYLHNGVGNLRVEGHEWTGVTDPVGGQLVSISSIEDQRFGQAAKTDIVIAGVDAEFFRSVKKDARALEGRSAILRFGAFDPETAEIRMFKTMLPGKMSAPTLRRQGVGTRFVGLTIEGFWESQNYPFGGRWTDADQRRRHPGDKGLMFVGQTVSEQWV